MFSGAFCGFPFVSPGTILHLYLLQSHLGFEGLPQPTSPMSPVVSIGQFCRLWGFSEAHRLCLSRNPGLSLQWDAEPGGRGGAPRRPLLEGPTGGKPHFLLDPAEKGRRGTEMWAQYSS